MTALQLKPASDCQYDQISLGEIMLRLDPGEGRIRCAREFRAWEGGGEYNVARGLRRCFGLRTAVCTAFADNDVGRLVEDFILQGGVYTRFIRWVPFDGVCRTVRNGLNFTERGFGVRGAVGVSDRGQTAASQLKPGDFDWKEIFGGGVRWFHSGGIFAALSETTAELIIEGMKAAKAAGAVTSFDLNFREKLWKISGGEKRAVSVIRRIVENVDVLVGNEEDLQKGLGIEGQDVHSKSKLDPSAFFGMIDKVVKQQPNVKVVATTLREVLSTNRHRWSAVAWINGKTHTAPTCELDVIDRIGGGDGFAAGFIYGLLAGESPEESVKLGWAHGALLTTFPGDTTMATVEQVRAFAKGGSARVQR